MKALLKHVLRRMGYVVYSTGDKTRVSGDDLLHDAKLKLALGESPVLFDVGANLGQTIDAMRGTFGSPQITSFEPSPATYAKLLATHGKLARIENIALGDRRATLPFNVTEHSTNDSLLTPTWDAMQKKVQVEVFTLDDYCERNNVSHIDILKIDAQGYDLKVLQGATRLLAENRVRALAMELCFAALYAGQASWIELLAYAHNAGFHLLGFYERTYRDDVFEFCDVCFVRG